MIISFVSTQRKVVSVYCVFSHGIWFVMFFCDKNLVF